MVLQQRDGLWEIGEVTRTSDGYKIATGVLVDELGRPVRDEDGNLILRSFFLGV